VVVGDANEDSSALVLTRAISYCKAFWAKPLPISEDPWVRAYAAAVGSQAIPPVNQLVFDPPIMHGNSGRGPTGSTEKHPQPPLGVFSYSVGGSWCVNVLRPKVEPSTGRYYYEELSKVSPPLPNS